MNKTIEEVFRECFDNKHTFRESIDFMSDDEIKECVEYYATLQTKKNKHDDIRIQRIKN
jgi:cytochrome c553